MRISLAGALLAAIAASVSAQEGIVTPELAWRTVETKHFSIHYPAAAEEWTLDMASRIDGAYDAVTALVGNAPSQRVTVLVEDPNNESNGFALPFLGAPLIFFWPTPPDPSSGIGDSRGWGELLSVHEYAHLAHLARPSRNPREAWMEWWPGNVGPIALSAPRWAMEGYATYVEGKITGRGRPHSVWRAAIIREWARNGQLPTYAQLDGDGRWLGGNMAYLVGSAYLEWLVARPGQSDSSLPHVWRRMTARTVRSFDAAFAGVFGAPPAELYGRFTAEVTANALALESRLVPDSALGGGASRTVQRLSWSTGSPALSPNDSLLAVPRAAREEPAVIVLWPARPRPDTGAAHRRAEEHKRDTLDVPGIAWTPAPLPVVRTRYPEGGASFYSPRWMPDGQHLLVTRFTGPGTGVVRSDLFLWNAKEGGVRRITRAAGILHADPMPDGRAAIADRCVNGICDLVRVDLATGALAVIVRGSPRVTYARPRVSPDGRTVAAARQAAGAWRVVLVDLATQRVSVAGPDDGADRYDPAWQADGKRLVVVSEAGGVPNIEEIDLASGAARPLTRVEGAVRAPEPGGDDGGVFFTRLRTWGYDLDRVNADSVPPLAPFSAASTMNEFGAAAFEPPVPADTFPVIALTPHDYGLGPRTRQILPSGVYAAEGSSAGLMVSGMDPVGKLTWMVQGLVATPGTWSGASAGAAWRGWPVEFTAEAFYSEDVPSRQWGFAAPAQFDATTTGGALSGRLHRDFLTNTQTVSLGASLASILGDTGTSGTRSLAYASYSGWFAHSWKTLPSSARLTVSGAAGSTSGEHWMRGLAELTLSVGSPRLGLEIGGSYGRIDNANAGYEQFSLGGTEPPLFSPALDAQRIAMPAIPAGVMTGRQVATLTAALPVLGLRPYYWQGSTTSRFDDWEKVVGLEASIASNGIWFARLPGFRVLGGAGYALSGAWKDQPRFYLSATFRP